MLVQRPAFSIGSFFDWLRRRGEHRAMLMTMDELSQSRYEVLSDIGITRDELLFASRRRGRSSMSRSA